ncbi:hypothetical protein DFH01_20495 [Falsiroseomonas bella]|uniref:Cadherin domain-containing protein n=1 Tax=Falsiroseomonas bella TaxID=2184016 RepID=A0A317F9X8_9PROT|nr:FG-GAP-like repeat-containing protein [Falsiroseomonas bella]PWS35941.1 hypothetical protein DFH01_20495 [Falsiroseomonas bella]
MAERTEALTIRVLDRAETAQLSGFGPVTLAENAVSAGPVVLDSSVFLTTGDTPKRLTLTGALAEDTLGIQNQGSGAGQIGVSGNTVTWQGAAIGTFTTGPGAPLVIDFLDDVPSAAMQPLLQALTFSNASNQPTASRTLLLDIVDAGGTHLNAPVAPGFTQLTGAASPFAGLAVAAGNSAPAFLDVDGDGRTDLIAGGNDGRVVWWKNTGSGFVAVAPGGDNSLRDVVNLSQRIATPAVADLDGDGQAELVVGDFAGGLQVWERRGDDWVRQNGADNVFLARSVTVAAITTTEDLFDYSNGMSFDSTVTYTRPTLSTASKLGLSAPAFGDIDGDGIADLVVGRADGGFAAFRGTGPDFPRYAPGFQPFLAFEVDPLAGIDAGSASGAALLDVDLDGRIDLVTGNAAGTLTAYGIAGTAFVPFATNPFAGVVLDANARPAAADVDGDGLLDLVVGGVGGGFQVFRSTPALGVPIAVTVTRQNDAPVITSASTVSITEGTAGIFYTAQATDPDGATNLVWTLSGEDAGRFTLDSFSRGLKFTNAPTVKPDFEVPTDANRDNVYRVTLNVTDGAAVVAKDLTITVTDVRETTTLTELVASMAVTEGAAAQRIDPAVTFTQGQSLDGKQLIVGGLLPEDRVSLVNEGSGAGQIGFDGSIVTFGGDAIGTATGGVGAPFVVTLNAGAHGPQVDALIQALTYSNVSDNPAATRTLTFDLIDATGRHLNGVAQSTFTLATGAANPLDGIDAGFESAPALVDLDGDGRLDLVSGNDEGALLAWRNTGTGFVPFAANLFAGVDVGPVTAPTFADLDGDGDPDLLLGAGAATYPGAIVTAWRNTGTAFVPMLPDPSPFTTATNVLTPQFVQLVPGGAPELILGDLSGNLNAFKLLPEGYYTIDSAYNAATPLPTLNGSSAATLFDLDGDGVGELIAGDSGGGLRVFRLQATLSGAPNNAAMEALLEALTYQNTSADPTATRTLTYSFRDPRLADFAAGSTKQVLVTVKEVNQAPVIDSPAAPTTIAHAENGTGAVFTPQATDADSDALTWSLVGGDVAFFVIDPLSGAVHFAAPPNFRGPRDRVRRQQQLHGGRRGQRRHRHDTGRDGDGRGDGCRRALCADRPRRQPARRRAGLADASRPGHRRDGRRCAGRRRALGQRAGRGRRGLAGLAGRRRGRDRARRRHRLLRWRADRHRQRRRRQRLRHRPRRRRHARGAAGPALPPDLRQCGRDAGGRPPSDHCARRQRRHGADQRHRAGACCRRGRGAERAGDHAGGGDRG